MPPIGIAHLTLLALSPPELVSTAAEAGYDFVGVRVKAVTEGEHQYPMAPGSPMSRETLLRLSDTGLTVRDVEFLQLRPDTGPDDWMPALEAGAALRSEEHTSELQSRSDLVCRLLLEKKKKKKRQPPISKKKPNQTTTP